MTSSVALHGEAVLDRLLQKSQMVLDQSPDTKQWLTFQETLDSIHASSHSCIDLFEAACRLYGQRPALGIWLDASDTVDLGSSDTTSLTDLFTLTYSELWQRIVACAGGFKHANICDARDRVGILGFASADFLVADLACLYLGAVSIPLQAGATSNELVTIIKEAEISCLVCSVDQWPSLRALLPACNSVRHIVLMDGSVQNLSGDCGVQDAAYTIRHLHDLERQGHASLPVPKFVPDAHSDPMVTVMYTSGSTGTPKGAVLTESMWFLRLRSALRMGAAVPFIHLNYLPLNHLAGRLSCARALLIGGMTYFTRKSDLSTLFSDIQRTRPTQLLLVPRVSSLMYQHFALEVLRRGGQVSTDHSKHPTEDAAIDRDDVYREMRATFLGDRLLSLSVGTAPTPPHIMRFLQECFQVPVTVGYGSTEGSIISTDHHIMNDVVDAYKLVDVPELGYFSTDHPHPRGELRIKSRQMVREYLNNPKATGELLDDDGYLQTGDIVEEWGPDHVVWIDRVKNVLKLAQGEFVTLWSLETLYSSQSAYVSQVYLYGHSSRAYLLAVVVPNWTAWGCPSRETFSLLDKEHVKQRIKAELIRIAQEHQLKSYEIPRDFIVETESFTVGNRLLTESSKLSRKNLQAKFGERLEAIYTQLEDRHLASIAAIRNSDAGRSCHEKFVMLIESSLNIKNPDLSLSFKELGGDSMAALEFAATIEAVLGIKIPVSLILNPKGPLQDIITYMDRTEQGDDKQVSVTSIHGERPSILKASDLKVHKILSPDEIKEARELAAKSRGSSTTTKHVLLTGANGFLGRFLAKDLPTISEEGGTIYCLVRAKTDNQARDRFLASFGKLDHDLIKNVKQLLSQGRIQVIAGDLILPRFGLAPDTYDRLVRSVDTVVHNGALVNHVFSYEALFEPNVLGTVEVLRFALKARLKKIAFISSVAAIQSATSVSEQDDIRHKIPERSIGEGYANGYGVSKWACEVVLREAQEAFGLAVAVFRCGIILASRQGMGHINPDDMVSRLIWGLVHTGTAPASFYRQDKGSKAPFSGLPVDLVSRAIGRLTRNLNAGCFATYHVVSSLSATGGSLDDFVGWIGSAGYCLERLPEHRTWYRTFIQKLQALDDKAKSQSPLAIAHQWQTPLESSVYDVQSPVFWAEWKAEEEARGSVEACHLDEAFVHKCLGDLVALELIPGPNRHGLQQRTDGTP